MKVFRFVEGKVAIACGASEVRDGSCEDSNVKNPHARWYRHFVKVVAALLNVTFCFRKKKKKKKVECQEVYPRRGRVNWHRLAFGVGKGRVPEDSSSEAVISEC